MTGAFADSYFYLALLNPRGAAHSRATAVAGAYVGRVITTHWVLVEVADAFSHPRHRPLFDRLLATVSADARVTILPADGESFDRGVELYRSRHDKDWPLTDCISFAVMNQYGLIDAFTADHHFEQAGFQLLLREP